MALYDFSSNDLSTLLYCLTENINTKKLPPMVPEIIVTQTDGIKKLLSLNIAKKNGICCNIKYLKPKYLIYHLLESAGLQFDNDHPLESKNIFWLITNALLDKGLNNSLKKYIEDSEIKLAQLAYSISDLFDQYFVYRPEMIRSWDEGRLYYKNDLIEKWQFEIYRHIVKKLNVKSFPSSVNNKIFKNLNLDKLPKRISLFGLSMLPPFYIGILNEFAKYIDIYLYLLNPSKEYWLEYISQKEALKLKIKKGVEAETLFYNVKNNLLSEFGKTGADFYTLLLETFTDIRFDFIQKNSANVNKNTRKTMLEVIKEDILNDINLNEIPKKDFDNIDDSVEIHSCHSPMREVEVLYNRLLYIFDNNPNMKPSDILVMTPDISTYAPFIDAVFGLKRGKKEIPYSISDVSYIDSEGTIKVFMDILNLLKGRFEINNIINIIESEAIKEKFSLNETDINIMKVCLNDAAVRWGLDSNFRKEKGIEYSYNEYSWEYGLDRLLLSLIYERDNLFENIRTVESIQANVNNIIAAISIFLYELYNLYNFSINKHSVDSWFKKLIDFVDKIFPVDIPTSANISREIAILKSSLDDMLESYNYCTNYGPQINVGLDFIIEYLKNNFKNKLHTHRFLDGGITFCEMIPMRSIPFKIICLIGLNNDTFPRQRKPLSFDLISLHPEKGDRNLRENDKYLFLETIISAKEKLYLSYVGQDLILNDTIPPSVLINQFIYYLRQRFNIKNVENIEEEIVIKDKISSFDPAYFMRDNEPYYINYSKEDYCAAEVTTNNPKKEKTKFIDKRIDIEPEDNVINIYDFLKFFENPIKHYFKKTLNINLEEKKLSLDDEEPFSLDSLNEFILKERLSDNYFKEKEEKNCITKYADILPPGGVGIGEFQKAFKSVEDFKKILLEKYTINKVRINYELHLPYKYNNINYTIEGTLSYFHKIDNNQLLNNNKIIKGELEGYNLADYRFSCGKAKRSDVPINTRLKVYLKHIILNYYESLIGAEKLSDSYLFAEGREEYEPIYKIYKYKALKREELDEILDYFLKLYLDGLKTPLHFIPKYSYEYYEKEEKFNKSQKIKDILEPFNREPDNYLSFYLKDLNNPEEDFFNKSYNNSAKKIFSYLKIFEEELENDKGK
ncbi:MAG: exodeoxyribonuclease V subunit gamma [Deferribacterota bacterium]|nr:exodeoxyribonuclease V subunit gamma [Deferribacterota bacterium]